MSASAQECAQTSATVKPGLTLAARALLSATDCLARYADRRWLCGEYVLAVTDARISADQMEALIAAREQARRALGIDALHEDTARDGAG